MLSALRDLVIALYKSTLYLTLPYHNLPACRVQNYSVLSAGSSHIVKELIITFVIIVSQ